VRPCRCGSVTRTVRCAAFTGGAAGDGGILCDKPCPALRACGRHRCNRVCCPLAALAGPAKGKGKKRAPAGAPQQEADDDTGLHACDLVCGKTLGCGNHTCEERDHRGACPPCLRSSFDEVGSSMHVRRRSMLISIQLVCRCGRTVMMPPIPCGTRIRCTHPCDRALLECGHSRVPHACHEDPAPCPPCPFLTTKRCACGKKDVPNVQCAQAKVACGTPCGKLLGCGFHRCVRLCHAGECGACTSVCGKPRKHWYVRSSRCSGVRALTNFAVSLISIRAQHPVTHPRLAPRRSHAWPV
jgi:transcriptional repressor NF-X1